MPDLSDQELLDALGVEAAPKKARARTPREERMVAGFEDIVRFREEHGRAPRHGEDRDIFERLYAVRLDRLRDQADARELLRDLDRYALLDPPGESAAAPVEALDDEALLAELGVAAPAEDAITTLRHVPSREEKRAAEEIANRERCPDFDRFKPLFERAERDLAAGARESRAFGKDAGIATGDFFILGGQTVYVAETGDPIRAPNGEADARLRVIYSNGTESNLLRRSLQRALYKDEAGRRLTEPSAGPLFGSSASDNDLASGTIYVLRSRSDDPRIARHRELIHKIGVTGGPVEARIAVAENDATYLLAGVELVRTYALYNINRTKLERVLHRVLASAQLDLEIPDRFGRPVRPREWFLVPLHIIDEVVAAIQHGSIERLAYNPAIGRLEAQPA